MTSAQNIAKSYKLPLEVCHIDTPVRQKTDTLAFQKTALYILAAEGKRRRCFPVAVDNTVAGNHPRFRVVVQGITHHPCPAGIARQCGNLSIGGNFALWTAIL